MSISQSFDQKQWSHHLHGQTKPCVKQHKLIYRNGKLFTKVKPALTNANETLPLKLISVAGINVAQRRGMGYIVHGFHIGIS